MRARTSGAGPEVAIVSNNPETVDGLESYLRAAGMTARRIRDIEKVARVAPVATIAVVLFPDDFRWEVVAATIAELRGRRRAMLPVLVTAHPRRFESLADQGALIVTRPAWGFTILDAIRAHIDGNGARKPQKARGYG